MSNVFQILSLITEKQAFTAYFPGILNILIAVSITSIHKIYKEQFKLKWLSWSFILLGIAHIIGSMYVSHNITNIKYLNFIIQIIALQSLFEFLRSNSKQFFGTTTPKLAHLPFGLISTSAILSLGCIIHNSSGILLGILYFIVSIGIYKTIHKIPTIKPKAAFIYSVLPFAISMNTIFKALLHLQHNLPTDTIANSLLADSINFSYYLSLFIVSIAILSRRPHEGLYTNKLYKWKSDDKASGNQDFLIHPSLETPNNYNLSSRISFATPVLTLLLILAINIAGGLSEKYVYKNESAKLNTILNNSSNSLVNLINQRISFANTASRIIAVSPVIENYFIDQRDNNKKRLYKILNAFVKNYPDGFCYLLDMSGVVIASSNNEDVLLGQNFSYRPYFIDAKAGKSGFLIATGRSTHQLGFYSSQPVINPDTGRVIGVCCVKKNLTNLGEYFKQYSPAILVDNNDRILLAHDESLIGKQFLLPIKQEKHSAYQRPQGIILENNTFSFSRKHFLHKVASLSMPNWRIILLKNTLPIRISEMNIVIMFLFVNLVLIILLLGQIKNRESLREFKISQARFKSIFDYAPESIMMVSPKDNEIISANPAMKKLFGFDMNENITGTSLEVITKNNVDCINSLQTNETNEQVFKKKNGKEFFAEIICTKVLFNNEQVFLMFLRDISVRKEIEINLKATKQSAEEASQLKSRFLTNTSHELRTPMTAIIGLTEIAKSQNNSKKQNDILNLIQDSSKSLLEMLNDILNLSHIETGKAELEPETFNLTTSINEIVQSIQHKAEQKGLAINLNIHKEMPKFVISDFKKIRQIFMNLLTNAIKFTAKGSINISVNMQIDANTQPILKFTISDTGIGMSREVQENIFKTFLQASPHSNNEKKGKGLGMIICKKIIDLLNGTISIESSVNNGSTFRCTIPVKFSSSGSDEKMQTIENENIKLQINGKPMKILVADDNEINLLIAKFAVEQYGGLPFCVKDGLEVLSILERETFDLILLDIQMPRLDGFETIKMIRNSDNQRYKNMPIIAISAYDKEAKLLGKNKINGYLAKPYLQKELIQKILNVFPNELDSILTVKSEAPPTLKPNELQAKTALKQINLHELQMRVMKKPENIKKIQTIFDKRSVILLEELKTNANDFEKLDSTIHSIKGLTGMLAANEAFNNSKKIEQYIKNNDTQNIPELIEKLESQLSEIADDLNQITILLEGQ